MSKIINREKPYYEKRIFILICPSIYKEAGQIQSLK